jgi:hypothetical protein
MTKPKLCAYASCASTEILVRINLGDCRPTFCSMLHAAAYLVHRMSWAEHTDERVELAELRCQAEFALEEIDRLRQLAKAEGAGA